MKKLILLILAAVMLLASCGGRGGNAEESKSSVSSTHSVSQKPEIPIEEALVVPEGELRKEIDAALTAYLNLNGTEISWADPSDLTNITKNFRCYGIFNGCAVIFFCPYQLRMEETKTIGKYDFFESCRFDLYGCKDGIVYDLNNAYEKGLVTDEDIKTASERHEAAQEFYFSRNI